MFRRVELALPDAFKTSLGATVFILEDYEHLSIRRSIEDNLLFVIISYAESIKATRFIRIMDKGN